MVIQDWTSIIVSSLQTLWTGFVMTLGNIIGALIILIIGLIIASGLAKLVQKVIEFVKLDKGLSSLGLKEYFDRAGISLNSAKFLGRLTYWFFAIVFVLAATEVLGFYALSNFLREVLLYIPNVIVAVLIMLSAFVLGKFLKGLVIASVKGSKLHGGQFLGSLTWWSVVIFGFLATLSQLGIAVVIIQSLVTGFVAMLAIAGGIAFGLGGKDYAGSLIGKLRDKMDSH